MANNIHYLVEVISAQAHLFRVTLTVETPDAMGHRLSLPVWTPGSYMIREFAKNILSLTAKQGSQTIELVQQNKHSWQTSRLKASKPLCVVAEIYGFDLSVRCAHLDTSHGFFNGAQIFLSVQGYEHYPHTVKLLRPQGGEYAMWRVATTLKPAKGEKKNTLKQGGFGVYCAENYDELIDHPVEMGTFYSLTFSVAGVPHAMAISGSLRFDKKRLKEDLEKICAWHVHLFGSPTPFSNYLFLTMVVGQGYGGLEHRDSTALLCSYHDLPAIGAKSMSDHYRTFLGLCSHEYFHAWHIKRIKPAAFNPYRLHEENYTSLLWVFEGFTSYYDDLALVRCGLISRDDYLAILAKTLTNVQRGAGRLKQSVAESSFDAWTKFYRQDENSPNAIVSYYAKGALVALALDLLIRAKTQSKHSLDDVMRYLWREYGQTGKGVGEMEMPAIVEAATGINVSHQINAWVFGRSDIAFSALFKPFGLELSYHSSGALSGWGARIREEHGILKLTHVLDGGALQRAGACAGDELIALDGWRVGAKMSHFELLAARYSVGEQLELVVFRRDELVTLSVVLPEPLQDNGLLKPMLRQNIKSSKLLKEWLS